MIHLVQCLVTKPYWIAVMSFLYNVLKAPHENFIRTLIILNTSRGTLISTEARAFVRHSFNAFYRDFAMVDTHNKHFNWKKTFDHAMTTYHRAVLRWATSIRIFHATRQHTSRKKDVAQATLHQFPTLITFNDNYTFTLTADFRAAINDAKTAAAPR